MKLKERNIPFSVSYQETIAIIAADRTREERLKCIKDTGNHSPAWFLRAALLNAIGVPKPKEKAENFLAFGCLG